MKKVIALIIYIFTFGNVSAQTFSMNTGVAPANHNTSTEQSVMQTNGANDIQFKPQALKGMKPLLLTGNSILINPNPVADQVTIINDELAVNEVRIENTSGQLVADKKTDATVPGVQVSVDVSKLPTGLYFITTLSGDRTETGNIIAIR